MSSSILQPNDNPSIIPQQHQLPVACFTWLVYQLFIILHARVHKRTFRCDSASSCGDIQPLDCLTTHCWTRPCDSANKSCYHFNSIDSPHLLFLQPSLTAVVVRSLHASRVGHGAVARVARDQAHTTSALAIDVESTSLGPQHITR
jgi:hypothetical protein